VALCSYKLATLPLEITLAQSEVATLRSALEQVDRRTTFVLQRKQEITEQLNKLEDHIDAEKPPLEPSNDPVYVDCGTLLFILYSSVPLLTFGDSSSL
jgi:pyruvate/oxaloacetate carboxyltransferase